jgi:hypothetical protein
MVGVLTAYFGPEIFALLDDLVAVGAASIRVILGANSASQQAWEAARDYDNAVVKVRVARPSPGGVLHPKLIVGAGQDERWAIVGSSNFSAGGFWGNVELNISLHESAPLESTSPLGVLHAVFAETFETATTPSPSLWGALVRFAPPRVPTGRGDSSVELQSVIAQLPPIGTPVTAVGKPASTTPAKRRRPRMPRTQHAMLPARTYISLLFQLSRADVRRPVWQPIQRGGTSQTNLPRQALSQLGLAQGYSGHILVEAVGVAAYAGTSEIHSAGFWPRPPRGPGRTPEAPRFTFHKGLKEFIRADIGSPAIGDVCVLEVPVGGASTASPIRVGVIPAAQAASLGLLPTTHRRGTRAGQPLFWDTRRGSVL